MSLTRGSVCPKGLSERSKRRGTLFPPTNLFGSLLVWSGSRGDRFAKKEKLLVGGFRPTRLLANRCEICVELRRATYSRVPRREVPKSDKSAERFARKSCRKGSPWLAAGVLAWVELMRHGALANHLEVAVIRQEFVHRRWF